MPQLMIGPAVRTGRKAGKAKPPPKAPPKQSRVVSGEVLDSSDQLYHGRWDAGAPKQQWQQAHHSKPLNDAMRSSGSRLKRAFQGIDDNYHREMGQMAAGLVAGSAVLGLGVGELSRSVSNKQVKQRRRELGLPVKKAWSKEDPFMWHAEQGKGGAHKVTIMGEAAREKRRIEGPKPKPDQGLFTRLGRYGETKRGGQVLAGLTVGGTLLALPRAVGPANEAERLQDQIKRRNQRRALAARQPVAKVRGNLRAVRPEGGWPTHQMTPEQLADQAAKRPLRAAKAKAEGRVYIPKQSPAPAASPLFTGRRLLAAGGITAAGGIGYLASSRRPRERQLAEVGKLDDKDRHREEALAAGGVGAAGLSATPVGRRVLTRPNALQRDTLDWVNDSSTKPKQGMDRIRRSAKTGTPSPIARRHAAAKPSDRHLYRGAAMGDVKPGEEHSFDMNSFSSRERQGQKFAHKRSRQNGGRPTVVVMEPGARATKLKYDAITDTFGTHRRKKEHLVSGKARVTGVRQVGALRYVHMAPVGKGLLASADRAAAVLERNKHNMVGPALGVGLGGAAVEGRRRQAKGQDRSASHVRAVPAAAAGTVGLASFKRYGMSVKDDFEEARRAHGPLTRQQRAVEREHRARYGVPNKSGAAQRRAIEANPDFARNYPDDLPGAKYRQKLGRMSGKRGKAMEAAAFAIPAALVGAPRRKLEVEKSAAHEPLTRAEWDREQARRGRAARRNDKRQVVLGLTGIAGGVLATRGKKTSHRVLAMAPGVGTVGEGALNLVNNDYSDRQNVGKAMTPEEVKALLAARPKPRTWTSSKIVVKPEPRIKGEVGKAFRHVPRSSLSTNMKDGLPGLPANKTALRMQGSGVEGKGHVVRSADRKGNWTENDVWPTKNGAVDGHQWARTNNKRVARTSVDAIPLRTMPSHAYGRIDVGKGDRTYGYMEERRNPRRTAQMGVGLGLAAHGASRLQVGRQVERGRRIAHLEGHGAKADKGIDLVRRGRNQVRRATGQAENVLRGRVPGFGSALDVIPKKLQPRVLTLGGAYLAARAHPTHDERFVAYGGW